MAGGGADKFSTLLRQERLAMASAFSRRRASPVRITTPVSMSSGMKSSVGVSPVDDGSQFRIVDELLAPIRSQGDRGLKQRLRETTK